ncbi:hypothetical protein BJV78DRAFT_86315 [Lactifluus subvellereus]|nr:hypothetical protein BJV78DRAFT_86315 [Lactifluus subvellereus]
MFLRPQISKESLVRTSSYLTLGPSVFHGLANFESLVASFDVDQSPWESSRQFFTNFYDTLFHAQLFTNSEDDSSPAGKTARCSISLLRTGSSFFIFPLFCHRLREHPSYVPSEHALRKFVNVGSI